MRKTVILACLLIYNTLAAQDKLKVTDLVTSFSINGEVEQPKNFTLADLQKMHLQEIHDFIITNHLGEKRSVIKDAKAIPLLEVMSAVTVKSPGPKQLSEYYFVCKAVDGYAVVFSWNELFNTDIGKDVYVIIEEDGKALSIDHGGSFLLISKADHKTGRRHVKWFNEIIVKRIQ